LPMTLDLVRSLVVSTCPRAIEILGAVGEDVTLEALQRVRRAWPIDIERSNGGYASSISNERRGISQEWQGRGRLDEAVMFRLL
jgi:hypothetical protein